MKGQDKTWLVLGIPLLVIAMKVGMSLTQSPIGAKYEGVRNCRMCHPDEFRKWSKTKHARAYKLLVLAKQEENEECLRCHTTGYGRGGFLDPEKTPDLKGVTCEACHGPGSEHNGDETKIVRTPSAAVCAGCHMEGSIH